jgi:RNA polymerase sigma factor (sigma-70 family)
VTSAKIQPRTPQDEQIVQALARDLDAGFVTLFQAYRHVVFSTALRMSGRWADAEDLAAESFLRAYRAVSAYPRSRLLALQPRSWLLTITVNMYRNQQRDMSRKPLPDPLEHVDEPDPKENVEELVDQRIADGELATLLATLPTNQRAAVVLRHVIGLGVNEIARILERPVGTVKSDVSRALRRLRQLYPQPNTSLLSSAEVCP